MNQYRRIALGAAAFAALGVVAAAAFAHPGAMGGGMGSMHGMGPMHDMHQGMSGPMMHGGPGGQGAGQQLMTPEERDALREKMRNAKTPEERQTIATATRAEMQKRAKEKGITLPEHRGPHHGMGMGQGSGAGEHKH